MSPAEWIALGLLVMAVLGGLAGLFVHSNRTSYRFGEHAERIKQAESRIGVLETDAKQVARDMSEINREVSALAATMQAMESAMKQGFEALTSMIRDLSARRRARVEGEP